MKRMVFNCNVLHDGQFIRETVCVSDGIFVSGGSVSVSQEVDASSCVLLPGFADVHVHLREPGFSYKETERWRRPGGVTPRCAPCPT